MKTRTPLLCQHLVDSMNGVQVTCVLAVYLAPDDTKREAGSASLIDHVECTVSAMGCMAMMPVWCRWRTGPAAACPGALQPPPGAYRHRK